MVSQDDLVLAVQESHGATTTELAKAFGATPRRVRERLNQAHRMGRVDMIPIPTPTGVRTWFYFVVPE